MFVVLLLNIVINMYGFYITRLSSAQQRSGFFKYSCFRVVLSSVLLSLKVIMIVLQALKRRKRQTVGVFLITLYALTAIIPSWLTPNVGTLGLLPSHPPSEEFPRMCASMGIHKGFFSN